MAHGLFVHADGMWSVENREPFQETLEVGCAVLAARARARAREFFRRPSRVLRRHRRHRRHRRRRRRRRHAEFMYHVATLLPYDPADARQSTKRKYLESNTAMIVFKDGCGEATARAGRPRCDAAAARRPPALSPLELASSVTCVIIVVELVEPATDAAAARYRVATVVKQVRTRVHVRARAQRRQTRASSARRASVSLVPTCRRTASSVTAKRCATFCLPSSSTAC